MQVAVVIPARNEAGSVAEVIRRCLATVYGCRVIVVDNASTDGTAVVAEAAGATVVACSRPGYGWAARAGTDAAADADVLVYIDGDGSMAPEDIPRLLSPIEAGRADAVCGRRARSRGAMPWHQALGNRVIGWLLRRRGVRLSELGPFRAVRADRLAAVALPGSGFAWPAEMLIRLQRSGCRIVEVEVSYSERTAGRSKVGGSPVGSLRATWEIGRVLLGRPTR